MKPFLFSIGLLLLQSNADAQNNPEKNFLKRNPSVQRIHWADNGNVLMITKKSGVQEKYRLQSKQEVAGFTKKYGALPVAPPPPPPPAPLPPPPPAIEK